MTKGDQEIHLESKSNVSYTLNSNGVKMQRERERTKSFYKTRIQKSLLVIESNHLREILITKRKGMTSKSLTRQLTHLLSMITIYSSFRLSYTLFIILSDTAIISCYLLALSNLIYSPLSFFFSFILLSL
jgi:hypothetical protein